MSRREEYTEASDGTGRSRTGRWRVIDVMATDVITADKNMPYKQVARLLADNDLSSVPVLSGGGRVLGVVSEADVLRREERSFSRLGAGLPRRTHRERAQAEALTASELMTAPAITIHPDAPLGAAARLMNAHHVRRLPVVNPAGELIGIVSRRDLMSVFLRPDAEIAAEVAASLAAMPQARAIRVAVSVADGEVILTGEMPVAGMIATAIKVASDVDGVVAISSRLTASRVQHQAGA
jgi:CBS-domain-containing membrane protein